MLQQASDLAFAGSVRGEVVEGQEDRAIGAVAKLLQRAELGDLERFADVEALGIVTASAFDRTSSHGRSG